MMSSIEQLFAPFILLGIILEMYQLNRARFVAIPKKNIVAAITSVLTSGLIYGIFITAGWYAKSLMPDLSDFWNRLIALVVLVLIILYSIMRDRKYNKAGKMIYSNFNLFALIAVARGIMHLMSGFVLALLNVNGQWFLYSYLLGILLFGVGVILAKGEKVHIFGISVEYIKIFTYSIAGALIILT